MKKKSWYFKIISSIIIVVGIIYVYASNTLNVYGDNKNYNSKWNIYFDNLVVKDECINNGSVNIDNDTVTFTSILKVPGDYFEFYIDVVNDGRIDAKLDDIIKSKLSEDEKRYLEYTVVYSNNSTISKSDILPKKSLDTIKVRIEYKKDITENDLAKETKSIPLSFSLNYIQAD